MRQSIIVALWAFLLPAVAAAQDFVLQPGDVISITVLEDANLNREVLIRPDGRINMPIAGVIEAAGRTPEQVQRVILDRLSGDFITPPTVNVALSALGAANQREELENVDEAAALEEPAAVYVIGVVSRPGPVEIPPGRNLTVLQALAVAGGPGVFAAKKRIQVRRRTDEGEDVFLFNYKDIEDGSAPIETLDLIDGDVIVVPERGLFE
ncbi:MAG: polysaccharide biosynthesis/export family protein [Pseudomonadota bacterium]